MIYLVFLIELELRSQSFQNPGHPLILQILVLLPQHLQRRFIQYPPTIKQPNSNS